MAKLLNLLWQTGVVLQGSGDDSSDEGSWVSSFYVSYTTNDSIPRWNYSNYQTQQKPTTIVSTHIQSLRNRLITFAQLV